MVARIRGPLVAVVAVVLAVAATALTYCFAPIYEARTILTLDAGLTKVLQNVRVGYPSIAAGDFIRFEYFATHNVSLMSLPKLSREVVKQCDLRESGGKPLRPERVLSPGLVRLLFENDGHGIDAKWISDTQQFVLAGFSKDPDVAVVISRTYAEAFLRENAGQFTGALGVLSARLASHASDLESRLAAADEEIRKIGDRYGFAAPDSELQFVVAKIYNLKTALEGAELVEKSYETQLAHLSEKVGENGDLQEYQKTMVANPLISEIKSEIVELRGALTEMSVEYTPQHPAYLATETRLNDLKQALKDAPASTLGQKMEQRSGTLDSLLSSVLDLTLGHLVYDEQVAHYRALIEKYTARLKDLQTAQSRMGVLREERAGLSEKLSLCKVDQSEILSLLEKPLPFFRVVSRAHVNKDDLKHYKFFPKRKRTLIFTFLVSCIGLSALVVARELHSDLAYHGWQLAALDETIPAADVPDPDSLTGKMDGGRESALVCRHLHTVLGGLRGEPLLRVTSGRRGEGRATIARAVAWYYKGLGESVVLVEGDKQHHTMSPAAGEGDRPGLLDCLDGQAQVADAVARTATPGIDVVLAGEGAAGPEVTPAWHRMPGVLEELKRRYQHVMFLDRPLADVNPAVADSLGPHAVLLVLRAGAHSLAKVRDLAGAWRTAGPSVRRSAVIINRAPSDVDLFSWNGLAQLTGSLIRKPFRFLKRRA